MTHAYKMFYKIYELFQPQIGGTWRKLEHLWIFQQIYLFNVQKSFSWCQIKLIRTNLQQWHPFNFSWNDILISSLSSPKSCQLDKNFLNFKCLLFFSVKVTAVFAFLKGDYFFLKVFVIRAHISSATKT